MSPSNEDGGNLDRAIGPRNGTRVPVRWTGVLSATAWPRDFRVLAGGHELDLPAIITDFDRDAERRRARLELSADALRQPCVTRGLVLFLLVDHRSKLFRHG